MTNSERATAYLSAASLFAIVAIEVTFTILHRGLQPSW